MANRNSGGTALVAILLALAAIGAFFALSKELKIEINLRPVPLPGSETRLPFFGAYRLNVLKTIPRAIELCENTFTNRADQNCSRTPERLSSRGIQL